ncbi:hypothetical protein DAEQUDRAFT_694819 [Daedalea quercina L-15889]|uniref:Nucleolar pre-ribosomal-associated protein 1 C-terminal domain-containing protein n=1 Tax=Daedalea quercina L-15889 TaxID=1314783 RepID=A0A165NJD3_9APHY|nr:hypothetical protein DAEQUDRAFT_694819 [Daedalea quercina L-15889]
MSARVQRKDASSRANYKFTNPADIRRALSANDEHALIEGLTALRNQLTIKHDEPPLSVSDDRLLLAKSWLEISVGAADLFGIWERTNSRQTSVLAPLIGLMSALLTLLSPHYLYHSLAQPIINNIFLPQWAHRLNTYLAGAHNELILVTLKLFYALSCFANGRERKSLFDVFAWEAKSLSKLLHMRRKGRTEERFDILSRPDIRTLFVLFLLSFVDSEAQASVKSTFLEQRRDILSSIFRGLWQDPFSVIRRVLEVCWTGIWSDPKVKRTLKIHVFNETILSQLLRVYDRDSPEDGVADRVPADVVHHFLLAICTRPGVGVCFKDNGWYPRDISGEDSAGFGVQVNADEVGPRKHSRINNKILANVLKTLKVNEDPRQQELALKVLTACPELVAGYWPAAALTLEPRLSSKWIANIAFFGQVISLPVPTSSFHLQSSTASPSTSTPQYNPVPPPLSTITENILPSVNIKVHLSRGLQAPSPLVRHCTALALAKCLLKYDAVVQAFRAIERALEEDAEGQWARRRDEVEREVRRRVPDFQVVLGFAQKSSEGVRAGTEAEGDVDMGQAGSAVNPVRGALLAESAQRLLWLYHRCMSALVAEARFDVGKLLLSVQNVVRPTASPSARTDGLDVLRQLHVLRLLSESDQFSWSGKAGGSHSNLYVLLKMYAVTSSPAIRVATATVLKHSLSSSLLFQHDPEELVLWLRSLPITVRSAGAQAPDGTPLTDDKDAVIKFLDDCAQQCAKTPYRYLEELQSLCSEEGGEDVDMDCGIGVVDSESLPSPLLMTIAEQLAAKLRGKRLSPSDVLAMMTFVRKLVCGLMSKTCQLSHLTGYIERLRRDLWPLVVWSDHPLMTTACRSEVEHLESYFLQTVSSSSGAKSDSVPAFEKLLTQLEASLTPETEVERQVTAFGLIDTFRFLQRPIAQTYIARLVSVVKKLYKPALRALFELLRPDQYDLWACIEVPARFPDYQEELTFDVLFAHCSPSHIEDVAAREVLASPLVSMSSMLLDIKRGSILIAHRLRAYLGEKEEPGVRNLLLLLAHIVGNVQSKLTHDEYQQLLEHVFKMDSVKQLCEQPLSASLLEGLSSLLERSITPSVNTNRQHVVAGFARFWSARASAGSLSDDELKTARLWITYADSSDLLALLDHLANKPTMAAERAALVEEALRAIARDMSIVQPKPSTIAALHSILPQSMQLENILGSLLHDQLPLCYDGFAPNTGDMGLRALITESTRRWSRRTVRSKFVVSIEEILKRQQWSDATADIVVSLVYRQPSARRPVLEWLKGDVSAVCTTPHLARVLFALVDSGFLSMSAGGDLAHLVPHYRRVVRGLTRGKNAEGTGQLGGLYIKTVCAMIEQFDPIRRQLLVVIERENEKLSSDAISVHLIRVLALLSQKLKADVADAAGELMSKALSWIVQLLASGDSLTHAEIEALADLGTLAYNVSPRNHLVEPILTAIAQQRLGDAPVIRFARVLVQTTALKPFTINKFLQSIVQHTQLYALSGQDAQVRDAIADLLLFLFRLHPSNTCQPTHVEPLLRLYHGSLSVSDTKILSIFRLFEAVRKTSCIALLSGWSASPTGSSLNALDAVLSLDPNRVLKTCLNFPQYHRMLDGVDEQATDDAIYDPVFMMLLLAQTLSSSPPSSALSWIQLFRTNVVSLLIRAVSARDEQLRSIALAQLAGLHKTLQDVDMQEQPHVLYVLNLMKDAVSDASQENVPRLPAFATLILAHALRAVFYPSNFIYPLTARYLLQRPELDTADVPMLFGMLYSSSEQWKKERGWIVRFLGDAMVGSDEWRIMQRRHTWDLLASIYQSEERDRALRQGILEVLANITCNGRATTSLVLKSALLSWIEMQVRSMAQDEGLAWVKILANILSIVDPAKIEAVTSGEWRLVLSRCLHTILTSPSCTISVFPYATDVLLRIALLPGLHAVHINCLIPPCLKWLQKMEVDIHVASTEPPLSGGRRSHNQSPPYSSRELFDHDHDDNVQEWGECVERLWRACMAQDNGIAGWDAFTHRLLVWNAMKATGTGGGSVVGDWARREVVKSLSFVH